MGHQCCCVVNCKNSSRKNKCKFYKFPVASWKLDQRNKWIAAVKRKNADGSAWYPKPHDVICSEHFIGGKKSEAVLSPSFAPTIFPSVYKLRKVANEASALDRHKRFMERRLKKFPFTESTTNSKRNNTKKSETCTDTPPDICLQQKVNEECHVPYQLITPNSDVSSTTFITNANVDDNICDIVIKTEIVENTSTIETASIIEFENNDCDKTSIEETEADIKFFTGISSPNKTEQLVDLVHICEN